MRPSHIIVLALIAWLIAAFSAIFLLFYGAQPLAVVALAAALLLLLVGKRRQTWKRWGAALTVSALIALELALAAFGFPYIDRAEAANLTIKNFCLAPMGCRFDADEVADIMAWRDEVIARGATYQDRWVIVNEQGYPDNDPFDAAALPPDNTFRVLAVGDSFTVGYSAELGHSYIETIERTIPDGLLLWNAAFSATGQEHQVRAIRALAPLMQPDLILITLTDNDYFDNLIAIGRFVEVSAPQTDKVSYVERYALDAAYNTYTVADDIVRYRFYGVDGVNLNRVTRWVLNTRIGAALGRAIILPVLCERDNMRGAIYVHDPECIRRAGDRMSSALRDLRATLDEVAPGVPVLALIIPMPTSPLVLSNTSAVRLNEVNIPYLDPSALLTPDDYRNPNPNDVHWNSAGHEKIGAWVAACIAEMMAAETVCAAASR